MNLGPERDIFGDDDDDDDNVDDEEEDEEEETNMIPGSRDRGTPFLLMAQLYTEHSSNTYLPSLRVKQSKLLAIKP